MKNREVIDHIVSWLKNYSRESSTQGFVVGISGGIDSALTSVLCALTEKQVLTVSLPIRQHPAEFARAKVHIQWLEKKFSNVRSHEINLADPFHSLEKIFPHDIQDPLSMANTRSRLRMLTLYAFACHHKMLVAGTGNKIEDFGVGFFTKYGDGGVDLSPIADLLKSEVSALAAELGINPEIISAPPTDGLYADSITDESQIGASYAELERAMAQEMDMNLGEREKEVLKIYTELHKKNRHKMVPVPVCIIPSSLR